MHTKPSFARTLPALALTSALLAGCGSSSSGSSSTQSSLASESPAQIVAAARSAVHGAASARVSGSIVSEGKPISLDMELLAGKGATGRLTIEGNAVDVIEVERAFYLKGTPAFYTHVANAAAAQLLQGKWLKAPAGRGSFASLTQLTDLVKLVDSALASHGTLASAGTTTIEGQQAVGVRDTSKGGILYVAASGPAYPLEIAKGNGEKGKILFSRWNQPVTLTAPPNAINIDQLQSGH